MTRGIPLIGWSLAFLLLWFPSLASSEDSSIVLGPLEKRDKYTWVMMSYTNKTSSPLTQLWIQCVGFRKDGAPLGEFTKRWDTRLNHDPIQPRASVFEDMPIQNRGHTIGRMNCSVIKRKP